MNLFSFKIILSKIIKIIFPVKGKNNLIKNKSKFYKLKFDVIGNGNVIELGRNAIIINCLIYIRGNSNKIYIQPNCHISNSVFWIEGEDCEIMIKNKTSIGGAHFGVAEKNKKILIEKNCMLSDNIYITTTDAHSILTLNDIRINHDEDVLIKENVWIGKNVTILKGSKIKENSIIGACSLVRGDIEPNSIYAGVPVKKIKENIKWIRERI